MQIKSLLHHKFGQLAILTCLKKNNHLYRGWNHDRDQTSCIATAKMTLPFLLQHLLQRLIHGKILKFTWKQVREIVSNVPHQFRNGSLTMVFNYFLLDTLRLPYKIMTSFFLWTISHWMCSSWWVPGYHGSKWCGKNHSSQLSDLQEHGQTQNFRRQISQWRSGQHRYIGPHFRLRSTRRFIYSYSQSQRTSTVPG